MKRKEEEGGKKRRVERANLISQASLFIGSHPIFEYFFLFFSSKSGKVNYMSSLNLVSNTPD